MLNTTSTQAFSKTSLRPFPNSTDLTTWSSEFQTTGSFGNFFLTNTSFSNDTSLGFSTLDLDNKSNTGRSNISHQQEFGSLEQQIAGIVLLVFAVVAVVLNSAILMAAKFTTGGRSPTLIFIRSLCVADILAGVFGITKHFFIQFGEVGKNNLFLGESVLFCSMVASCCMVLGLSWESYLRIAYPLEYVKHIQKHIVIGTVVFSWNCAFVFGFAPQMGWSNSENYSSEKFYEFYTYSYLISFVIAYFVFILITVALHLKISALVRQLQRTDHHLAQFSRECRRSIKFVKLTVGNAIILFISYTPLLMYILLRVATNFSGLTETIHLYLYPGVLLKSVASPLLNGVNIKQIRHVLADCCLRLILRRFTGTSLQHRKFHQNSSSSSASLSIVSRKSSTQEHTSTHSNGKTGSSIYTIPHCDSYNENIEGDDILTNGRMRSQSLCISCDRPNPNRLQVSQHRCCHRSVSNGTLQTEVSLSSSGSDIGAALSIAVPEQLSGKNSYDKELRRNKKHHSSDNSIQSYTPKIYSSKLGSVDKLPIHGTNSDSVSYNKSSRPKRRVSFSDLLSYQGDSTVIVHKTLASTSSNLPLTSNEIIEETPL